MKTTLSRARHKPAKRILSKAGFCGTKRNISVNGRLWLEIDGETYLAHGRITLLERIDEYGSITKAAKSMEMSYRHAWVLVNDMNNKAPSPLVMRISGGKGGGGTSLTAEGKAAVTGFNAMLEELEKLTQRLAKTDFSL